MAAKRKSERDRIAAQIARLQEENLRLDEEEKEEERARGQKRDSERRERGNSRPSRSDSRSDVKRRRE